MTAAWKWDGGIGVSHESSASSIKSDSDVVGHDGLYYSALCNPLLALSVGEYDSMTDSNVPQVQGESLGNFCATEMNLYQCCALEKFGVRSTLYRNGSIAAAACPLRETTLQSEILHLVAVGVPEAIKANEARYKEILKGLYGDVDSTAGCRYVRVFPENHNKNGKSDLVIACPLEPTNPHSNLIPVVVIECALSTRADNKSGQSLTYSTAALNSLKDSAGSIVIEVIITEKEIRVRAVFSSSSNSYGTALLVHSKFGGAELNRLLLMLSFLVYSIPVMFDFHKTKQLATFSKIKLGWSSNFVDF